jgi:hypothetical protein
VLASVGSAVLAAETARTTGRRVKWFDKGRMQGLRREFRVVKRLIQGLRKGQVLAKQAIQRLRLGFGWLARPFKGRARVLGAQV